jgi:hypothetical protein
MCEIEKLRIVVLDGLVLLASDFYQALHRVYANFDVLLLKSFEKFAHDVVALSFYLEVLLHKWYTMDHSLDG